MIWFEIGIVLVMFVLLMSLCAISKRADNFMQEILDNLEDKE